MVQAIKDLGIPRYCSSCTGRLDVSLPRLAVHPSVSSVLQHETWNISIVEDPNIQVQGYLSNSYSAYRVPCHCVCRPLLVEEGCHLSDS